MVILEDRYDGVDSASTRNYMVQVFTRSTHRSHSPHMRPAVGLIVFWKHHIIHIHIFLAPETPRRGIFLELIHPVNKV